MSIEIRDITKQFGRETARPDRLPIVGQLRCIYTCGFLCH